MSIKIPAMPTQIDDGGRAIFDWADKLSKATEKAHRVRRVRESILNANQTCGSCKKWITRECPRERNVNGTNYGPSMNSLKCDLFAMKEFDRQRIDALEAELAGLQKE